MIEPDPPAGNDRARRRTRWTRRTRWIVGAGALALVAAAVTWAVVGHEGPATDPSQQPTDRLAARVSGRDLVDGQGQRIQLRGVNRPGMEYRCVQGVDPGFITGDEDTTGRRLGDADAVVGDLRSWDGPGAPPAINTVRLPLNEACWLGTAGIDPAFSGSPYRAFVRRLVDELTAADIYVVLDLHWSASAGVPATSPDVGPNRDRSVELWRQLATEFKDTPSVLFDLFNEPRVWCHTAACDADYDRAADISSACYRDGCTYRYDPDDGVVGRPATVRLAGTQDLVDVIRSSGAPNVILVAGLGYANAFDRWVEFLPEDPLGQLAASLHTYPDSGANVDDVATLDDRLAEGGLSSSYPVIVGEFGEIVCDDGQPADFAAATMDWADQHHYSYLAWGWDAGEGCAGPSLVVTNDGSPSPYGSVVRDHLRRRAAP